MGNHRYLLQGESKTKIVDGLKIGTVKYGYKDSFMPMDEEDQAMAKENRVVKYWEKQNWKGIKTPDFVVWNDKFKEGAEVYRTEDLGLNDFCGEMPFICFLTKKNGQWKLTKESKVRRLEGQAEIYKRMTANTFKKYYKETV
jgi:hypothetical protein|tara:strand:- start:324 stop:749 length:426 start_codon:yes stop_codon:yes gene_type:complete